MAATKKKIRKAVFPAAGLGTRFLPATKAQPKEMLPLVDKPIIQYVIEEAVASGLTSIIIVTGKGKNAIEDHFDVSYELERHLAQRGETGLLEQVRAISSMISVSYVRQGEQLGLGHAVLQARDVVGDEPFAVMLGDDIFYEIEKAGRGRGGEIQLSDGIRRLEDKRPVYGYRFEGVRHDAGNKLGFLKATVEFALKREDLGGP